jgi:4'-phosphopantetheinyl transferase
MQTDTELHLLNLPSLPTVRVETLLQTLDAHPALARGVAPPGLLAPAEEVQHAGLRVEKRRRDWLLGRWTAKHLLQSYLQREAGRVITLDGLLIGQDGGGAPFASLAGPPPERLSISLSISHSGDRAFCALTDQQGLSVGADTELVRLGLDEMARQFFAIEESAWLDSLAPAARPAGIIAVWSAKEAVLKALRLGLAADTRRVVCLPQELSGPGQWSAVKVRCDDGLLRAETVGEVTVWCRSNGDYVEALAVRQK